MIASAAFGASWVAGAASGSATAAPEVPLTLGAAAAMIAVLHVLKLLFLYLARQKG